MGNVYSEELLSGSIATGGTISYTVPSGYRAVVRDVVLHNAGVGNTGLQGAQVYDDAFQVIAIVWAPLAVSGRDFHWSGHQVVDTGHQIIAYGADANWRVRVSGYLLSLP